MFSFPAVLEAGIVFLYIAVALFLATLGIWIARTFLMPNVIKEDWNSLNRISFTTVIPLSASVMNAAIIAYYGFNVHYEYLYLVNYFIDFTSILFLSFFLGYKLYTKSPVHTNEISYGLLIPPVAISSNVLLGSSLMRTQYFNSIIFLTVIGVGIALFLFLFIGIMTFASYIRDQKANAPSPMLVLPVGVSSIIVINILAIATAKSVFQIPMADALTVSFMLWAFELWNFVVAMMISLKRVFREPATISIWAYTFPMAIFSVSSLDLRSIIGRYGYITASNIVYYIGIGAWVILIVAWVYAVMSTAIFLSHIKMIAYPG
ncbi:conserved hypothetical protein [Thermoplasma acidophilum]|uniref:Uncharacterized protein n=1 Tax=Thermoplasma acidophilum (strain ATCC 25905 / DSM 1728 / JCM 9062 / NBRC 15155 / AMRC-C165) TaxID=273075 RepID=Q9HIG8_THEAC|nr:conserved hypothetical protein [Thermoplasma acidophilum]